MFEFIKMRNYLKLKLFHGYYINISIDLRLEPTVAANVVGRVSKYIRKNQIFITSIAIRESVFSLLFQPTGGLADLMMEIKHLINQ